MALGRLFSALPVRQGDPADQIEVYVIALVDVSFYALEHVVLQAISGQHPKLSKRFAPTTAELGEAVREEMANVSRQLELAQDRLRIADNRPVAVRPKLLHERQTEARNRMTDERRALIASGIAHAASIGKMRECPVGSKFVAITGEIYGPPGSIDTAPPAPPAADDIPW